MKKGLSSKPFGFFVEENDSANNLQPLYLLCTKEPDNQLFFFITSSNSHCWVKQANSWERLEIKNLLFARDGGSRTYCFKDNHYHIDRLDIPYPFRNNAQYTSLIYGQTIALTAITLSQEELDCNDISNLEALDLTILPETREQAQQQLALVEKKQAIEKGIQKVGMIIHTLQRALETIFELEVPQRSSIQSLREQIHHYEKIKAELAQSLLQQPAEAISEAAIQARFSMQI